MYQYRDLVDLFVSLCPFPVVFFFEQVVAFGSCIKDMFFFPGCMIFCQTSKVSYQEKY